jgi:hypothetical protein
MYNDFGKKIPEKKLHMEGALLDSLDDFPGMHYVGKLVILHRDISYAVFRYSTDETSRMEDHALDDIYDDIYVGNTRGGCVCLVLDIVRLTMNDDLVEVKVLVMEQNIVGWIVMKIGDYQLIMGGE